jgi:hypothetical protein
VHRFIHQKVVLKPGNSGNFSRLANEYKIPVTPNGARTGFKAVVHYILSKTLDFCLWNV